MNILAIANNDPAGTAINFVNAINRYTDHIARLVTLEANYGNFQRDLHIPDLKNFDEVEYLLKRADVFHLHMVIDDETKLGPFRVGDYVKWKIVVHHHHGEPPFRKSPELFRQKEKSLGRKTIVSTPDLLKLYPDAFWIPNTLPIFDADYLPYRYDSKTDSIVIGHSPTRRELKNTEEFLDAMSQLGLKPLVIENVSHKDCLSLKRQCNIFFDHMQGYYGVSSLEALSQGIPTIAGLDEWNTGHIKEFTGAGKLPWVIARNVEELKKVICVLVGDKAYRENSGFYSREFMEKYWTEERIVERLINFYER